MATESWHETCIHYTLSSSLPGAPPPTIWSPKSKPACHSSLPPSLPSNPKSTWRMVLTYILSILFQLKPYLVSPRPTPLQTYTMSSLKNVLYTEHSKKFFLSENLSIFTTIQGFLWPSVSSSSFLTWHSRSFPI